jgi:hypothetical protein
MTTWRTLRGGAGAFAPVLLLAAAATAALPPVSRSLEASERAARELAVTDESGARQLPFAGFTIYQPARREWTVFAFYLMFREVADGAARRRESYWIGRRTAGTDSRKAPVATPPEWTSSDHCAGLDPALRSMGDVIGERLETTTPGEGDPTEVDTNPTQFRLWTDAGRFHGTGFAVSIAVSSVAGSPAANWIEETAAALAGCWTAEPPAPPHAATAAPR